MKEKIKIIYQLLIGLLIFLIPSNLFLKFLESSAYVNGLQIDYLIPKLYLSDLIVIALICLSIFENKKKIRKNLKKLYKKSLLFIKKNNLLSFLILAIFLRQINADYFISSLWYLAKIFEIIFLIILIKKKRKIITDKLLITSLLPTVFFQSIIAIFQFINQKSVYGYLLLGEGNLGKQIGLAKQVLNGVEKILPYGTTAHPNILAGFLSISLIIALLSLNSKNLRKYNLIKQPFVFIPIFVGLIALFLTFSWSAWLVIFITIALYISKNQLQKKYFKISFLGILIVPLIIFILAKISSSPSIVRRNYLNQASINMFIKNPIWGVGLNNFTANVEKYSKVREVVRFTQPVHHSFLLLLSEVGILGVTILYLLIKRNSKKIKQNLAYIGLILLILSPIIALDHYLISNQTGLLLMGLIISLPKNFLIPLQK